MNEKQELVFLRTENDRLRNENSRLLREYDRLQRDHDSEVELNNILAKELNKLKYKLESKKA